MYIYSRPPGSRLAPRMPSRGLPSFAPSGYSAHLIASQAILTQDHMRMCPRVDEVLKIAKPARRIRFAPSCHRLLFSFSELDDPMTLRIQRLAACSINGGLRSFALSLSADVVEAAASLSPIKTSLPANRAEREAHINENNQNDRIDVETPPIDDCRVPSPLKILPPATTIKAATKPKILPMPVPRNVPQVKTLGASYADAFGFLNRAEVVMKGIENASSEEKCQLEKDAAKLIRLAWGITGAIAAEKGDSCPEELFNQLKIASLGNKAFFNRIKNVFYVFKQLEKMHTFGCFKAFNPNAAVALNLGFIASTKVSSLCIENLLCLGQYAYTLLRYDGGFEHVLAVCVREAARRCTFSWEKFYRFSGKNKATEIASMTGILALTCKNFTDDMARVELADKTALQNGPWRNSIGNWVCRAWNGTLNRLDSRHQGKNVPAQEQLHFSEAPKLILTIAKFLGNYGIPAVPHLDNLSLAYMAADVHGAIDEIKKIGCRWWLGDMAVALTEFVRVIANAGIGHEVPRGSLMAAIEHIILF